MNNIYGSSQYIVSHENTSIPSNSCDDSRLDRSPEENAATFHEILQAHADHISGKRAMELLAPPKG